MKIIKSVLLSIVLLSVCSCDNSEKSSESAKSAVKSVEIDNSQTKTDRKKLKIASLNWAPYSGEKLEGYGVASKKIKKLFNQIDCDIDISFMSWKRVLYEVEQGNYDVGYPAYYSKERAKKYIMSDNILDTPLLFIKNKDDKIEYNKLEDLKGSKIGVVRGYVNTEEFDNAKFLDKFEGSSDVQLLRLLVNKRLKLAVIDKFVAKKLIKENKEFENKFDFLKKPLDIKTLHIMFSKTNDKSLMYVNKINKILKKEQNAK